jgi:hypothetical protein
LVRLFILTLASLTWNTVVFSSYTSYIYLKKKIVYFTSYDCSGKHKTIVGSDRSIDMINIVYFELPLISTKWEETVDIICQPRNAMNHSNDGLFETVFSRTHQICTKRVQNKFKQITINAFQTKIGFSILWKIRSNMGCKPDFFIIQHKKMSRSFISDRKIVYFRGVSLIWSAVFFTKMEKPILAWNTIIIITISWKQFIGFLFDVDFNLFFQERNILVYNELNWTLHVIFTHLLIQYMNKVLLIKIFLSCLVVCTLLCFAVIFQTCQNRYAAQSDVAI